ncbi:uncharacterized protein LOC143865837 [Tasmannia lanceolata]|uniref:uncharacterized protein LOC143865789 n=1 Tax=Tasmannia lanceolata TaxID=3420 RepID=UPI004062F4B1
MFPPFEVDLDEEQYAAEYCATRIDREKEMFEKFETEMSEKFSKMAHEMEQMKVQGPKKFDVSELIMSSTVSLPPNFKAHDYDKYDGTGCPRNHMRWFIILSQQYGLSREQMAQLFPIFLIGIANKWFLRLKLEEVRTPEDIYEKLIEQFSMEEGIEVTKRYLKQLKQGPQETFTYFIRRWRRKSAQLSQRISKSDQIKLVLKSLSPQYFHFLTLQHYPSFDHLIKTGTQTEDAIAKGLRAKVSSKIREGKRPVIQPKKVHAVSYTRPVARVVTEAARAPRRGTFDRKFDPLPYPITMILKRLMKDSFPLPDIKPPPNPLPTFWRMDQYCEYHRGPGHLTENCLALKHAIHNMIDKDELAVERPNVTQNPFPNHHAMPPPTTNAIFTDEPLLDPSTLICAITTEKTYVMKFDEGELEAIKKKQPYVISFDDDELAESSSSQSCVFQTDNTERTRKTPYVLRAEDFEEKDSREPYVVRMEEDELLLLDDHCDEMRHMTRGGRVFKPPELSVENPAEVARNAENQRQNKHRKLVLRELNSAQVSIDATPDELVSLVAMTRASKVLSFTDEDLLPEGQDHTKSLKITVVCNKKKVPEVLVDNGSALNVCPLSTATTLRFGPEDFIPSEQGILAYDDTRRDVIGTLVTEIQIGREDFKIEFQVLDIKASFLLLLGHPWLHKFGVVPSSLHQKLKFLHKNRMITVRGDPDLEIGLITQDLTVGKADDISLTGFSLEVTAITFEEAMNEEICFLTSTNLNVIGMIRRQGHIPGAGLGKYHQGLTEFLVFKAFNGLFGLGYKPKKKEVKEIKQLMLKWAECCRRGLELPMAPIDLIMNGRFRKEGADFPFCGFAETWLDDSTRQRLPGFEIFFDLELEDEPTSVQITEIESETDWTERIERSLLSTIKVESPEVGGDSDSSSGIESDVVSIVESDILSIHSSESVDDGVNIFVESVNVFQESIVKPDVESDNRNNNNRDSPLMRMLTTLLLKSDT